MSRPIIYSIHFFLDDSPFAHIFRKQISHLTISIDHTELRSSVVDLNKNIYARIFTMFPNLVDFDFSPASFWRGHARLVISNLPPMAYFLPNIINLRINVDTLNDCLYLLDGRLTHLRTLSVRIAYIQACIIDIDSTVKIILIIYFSCSFEQHFYSRL